MSRARRTRMRSGPVAEQFSKRPEENRHSPCGDCPKTGHRRANRVSPGTRYRLVGANVKLTSTAIGFGVAIPARPRKISSTAPDVDTWLCGLERTRAEIADLSGW